MLLRLLRRPITRKSSSSLLTVRTILPRSFFTRTRPVRASSPTVAKKEEEQFEQEPWVETPDTVVPDHQRSIPEFIKELGWWPFGISIIAAGFSKELILVSPNLMLGATEILIAVAGYFALAEPMESYYRTETKSENDKRQVAWNLLVEALKERISILKADIATEAFVKDLALHWKASEIEAAKYSSIKAKHDARNDIVVQLEAVARKEKAVQAAGTKVVAGQLRRHVRQVWATPDRKLKDEAFRLALDSLLAPQPIDPKNSPVYGLYLGYLRGGNQARV